MKHWLMLAALICFGSPAFADHDNRSATDKGTYSQTYAITGSSITGTEIGIFSGKRMDWTLFNTSTHTVFIGTTAATMHNAVHSNIGIGLPVIASDTYRMEGSNTGPLYVTCGGTLPTCTVRVLEHLNQ